MQVKFDVFWTKNLGTLYKDNSVDTYGKEANVNVDLKEVLNIYANFKVGENSFTDSVEILDIENRLIRIPFKSDVLKEGLNEFEIVAAMKNGDVLPSQTYSYKVDKSLQSDDSVKADTNYPILVELIQEVDNTINKVDTYWEEKEIEIDNRIEEALSVLPDSSGQSEAIKELKTKVDNHEERLNILEDNMVNNTRIDNLENKVNVLEPKVLQNEKDIKKQGVLVNALFDLTETISITEEGNAISLLQSKDGTVMIEGLEGNTLVNYCKNGSEELILTEEEQEEGYNAIIKPSTKYTIVFDTDKTGTVGVDLGGAKTSTTNNVATITTPSTLTDNTLKLTGKGIKVDNVMVLEGDKTSCVPSYFEGMKSCFEDKKQDNGSYEVEIVSYNENKSNSIQLQLSEPLRCVGDIKDRFVLKDGKLTIERNCGEVILNGNEEWQMYGSMEDYTSISLADTSLNMKKYGEVAPNYVKCDRFIPTSYSVLVLKKYSFIAINDNNIVLRIEDSKLNNIENRLDSFKEWLKENPTKVVYQLAEPTYEEIPYEAQKLILECFENGTLFIDTNIPPTVSVTYSANKPVVAKLNQVDNTTNINTEDIAITQIAVDFLLMSTLGEEMINFKTKGGTNMSAYFASRIIKGALKYEDVIRKYPNYKEDIDLILIAEGYSDLIVEL